jgi:hypothetical protein
VPIGCEWIHEIKHDGYRMMVRRDASGIRLLTRNGNGWTGASLLLRITPVTEGACITKQVLPRAGSDSHPNLPKRRDQQTALRCAAVQLYRLGNTH